MVYNCTVCVCVVCCVLCVLCVCVCVCVCGVGGGGGGLVSPKGCLDPDSSSISLLEWLSRSLLYAFFHSRCPAHYDPLRHHCY